MRVVNLSNGVERIGAGAAIATLRHHLALRRFGIDSWVFTWADSEIEGVCGFSGRRRLLRRLIARMRYEWLKNEHRLGGVGSAQIKGFTFSDERTHFGREIAESVPNADIYHFHNIVGFVDIHAFFERHSGKTPIVWTLHDFHAMTGGCHVNYGCDGYLRGCIDCPQGGGRAARASWQRKKLLFDGLSADSITFTGPCDWISDAARISPLIGRFRIQTIPLAIDETLFKPGDKARAKKRLGIDPSRFVIGFVAAQIFNSGKGLRDVLNAMQMISKQMGDPVLLLIGRQSDPFDLPSYAMPVGNITDDAASVEAYQSMDLFVTASRQESFGQTVLEANACGVPVVGSDVGGIGYQLADCEGGYLFNVGDVPALANNILRAYANVNECLEKGRQGREKVLRRFSYQAVASLYSKLYFDLAGSP